jgi:hypothetical protein
VEALSLATDVGPLSLWSGATDVGPLSSSETTVFSPNTDAAFAGATFVLNNDGALLPLLPAAALLPVAPLLPFGLSLGVCAGEAAASFAAQLVAGFAALESVAFALGLSARLGMRDDDPFADGVTEGSAAFSPVVRDDELSLRNSFVGDQLPDELALAGDADAGVGDEAAGFTVPAGPDVLAGFADDELAAGIADDELAAGIADDELDAGIADDVLDAGIADDELAGDFAPIGAANDFAVVDGVSGCVEFAEAVGGRGLAGGVIGAPGRALGGDALAAPGGAVGGPLGFVVDTDSTGMPSLVGVDDLATVCGADCAGFTIGALGGICTGRLGSQLESTSLGMPETAVAELSDGGAMPGNGTPEDASIVIVRGGTPAPAAWLCAGICTVMVRLRAGATGTGAGGARNGRDLSDAAGAALGMASSVGIWRVCVRAGFTGTTAGS